MQEAKGRIWQFSYLKRRLETKHIKAFLESYQLSGLSFKFPVLPKFSYPVH
jgi:hypothetical protein